MGKIVYKPHCEQCGSLIKQNVQFKQIKKFEVDHYHLCVNSIYEFYPYRCKVCGTVFDSAEFRPPKEVEHFIIKEDTYEEKTI